MNNRLMIGLWRLMIQLPPALWEGRIARTEDKFKRELRFMTDEHRAVHHYVVRQLPAVGVPLSPESVAAALGMARERVDAILDDLERHMTFLYRNGHRDVVWAYPVTVEKTPHRLTFNTGEKIYAAWAADAFAAPFVQGRLRKEFLVVTVATECAHCGRPMEMEIDSDLHCRVKEDGCRPMVFMPDVDLHRLKDVSIINAFWKESVFFWSEEHAKAYRKTSHRLRGAYFTAEQLVLATRVAQSVLFAFDRTGP
jgi:hypothetical protein